MNTPPCDIPWNCARVRAFIFIENTRICSRRDERLVTTLQGTASEKPAGRDSESNVCEWGYEGVRVCVKNRERISEWANAREGEKESEWMGVACTCVCKEKAKRTASTQVRAIKEIEGKRNKERMIDRIETTVLDGGYSRRWYFFLFLSVEGGEHLIPSVTSGSQQRYNYSVKR